MLFRGPILGAYYAKAMEESRNAGRITSVPYDPAVPVWTAWDLGFSDATAIWFAQVVGREIHVIDYYEASGVALGHYVRELRSRPFVYARHILPHDAEAKELGSGKSRTDTLQSLGLFDTTILPQHRVEDGINAVRMLLPRCWFDAKKCERGIEALTLYRADTDKRFIDPNTKQPLLKAKAVHDWTSHAADAFRYLAEGIDDKGFYAKFNQPIVYPKMGIY